MFFSALWDLWSWGGSDWGSIKTRKGVHERPLGVCTFGGGLGPSRPSADIGTRVKRLGIILRASSLSFLGANCQ